jgi:exonuclease SbcC
MIVKLTLENFLAHGASVFEFAAGLNVLTGPNNSGKSAVVEALRCLAENPIPKHVIRHGAKQARVTAELDDGTRVAWVRTPKYALYELTPPGAAEPQTYAKFGRTPPEDVLAALRLDRVPLEGSEDSIDVHLGNQREPVFLLNESGAVMASFFASSTESAHLIAMQNLLTDRTRKAKREKVRLDAAADAARQDLDRLARLPDIEMALEAGRGVEEALAALARDIPALAAVIRKRAELVRRLSGLAAKTAALQHLAPAPQPFDVLPLARTVLRQAASTRTRARAAARAAALAGLAAPPDLADAAALSRAAGDMRRIRAALARAQAKSRPLSELSPPPQAFPVAALDGLLAGRRVLADKAARLAAIQTAHARLAPPPAPQDAAPLADLLARVRTLRDRRDAASAALAARETRLEALHAAVETRLREVGMCPLCGGELHPETFLDSRKGAA